MTDPEAPRAGLRQRLEALIERWREEARRARPLESAPLTAEKRHRTERWIWYTNRANELEAALRDGLAVAPQSDAEQELAGIKKLAKCLRLEDLIGGTPGDIEKRSEIIKALKTFEAMAALQIQVDAADAARLHLESELDKYRQQVTAQSANYLRLVEELRQVKSARRDVEIEVERYKVLAEASRLSHEAAGARVIELVAQLAEAVRVRETVAQHEWHGYDVDAIQYRTCQACYARARDGHKADCWLGLALGHS